MLDRFVRCALAASAIVLSFFQGAIAAPVTDDRGVAVELRKPPMRIVTLLPSLTETVCELGACNRIVGVDTYSNWPESVRAVTHVGGVDDANIETIVSLKPDLVLLSSTSRALERLESLGVPVFGADLKTIADVYRANDKVAQLLGVSASDLRKRIDDGLASAVQQVPASSRGLRVYFEVAEGPYAASASSHIGELLTLLGTANVVPGELGSVPKLNPEFVVRANPQLIIISASEAPTLKGRPGWRQMTAMRSGRVCMLSRQEDDVVARPGPRLAEAARVLARCLQPPPKGPLP